MKSVTGVYVMQVASMLTGMHPQTLRKYERAGFIEPSRSKAFRLYSDEDVTRLKMIKHMVDEGGLNLAGVELVLKLHDKVRDIKQGLASGSGNRGRSKRLEQYVNEMLEILGQSDNKQER